MPKALKILLQICILFFIFCVSYFVNQYLTFDAKNIDFSTTSTKVLDNNNQVLYEISKDNAVKNTPIKYDDLPKHCVDALVATEDKTFWNNIGLDFNGTARLGISLVSLNNYSSGGSTISQQVIKLSDLSIYNRNPFDKLKEISRAVKLNQNFSKEEILVMYFNNAYFGNLNYGIEAASQDYLDKQTKDLSISECTYLVGLPQGPSIYNPYVNLSAGRDRQLIVLRAMNRNGYISDAQVNAIFNSDLDFKLDNFEIKAPHFVQFLQDNLGIKTDKIYKFLNFENSLENINWNKSYSVQTYYDYKIHKELQAQLRDFVNINQDKNINNASAIVLGKNNEVLTMIGSTDFFNDEIDGKFNSSIGFRQPGSLYIPLVYSFGLEDNIYLNDSLSNSIFKLNVKVGQSNKFEKVEITNKNGSDKSFVSLETAIKENLNIPATMIVQGKTTEKFKRYLELLPISMVTKNKLESFSNYCNEILTQEGCEISLLDLVILYNGLKNNGDFKSLKFIKSVKDLNGNIVWQQDENFDPINRLNTESFKEVNNLLQRNQNDWVWLTGTVRNSKDYMLIGFNENYTVGIWIGNTKGTELTDYSNINFSTKTVEDLF